MAFAIGVCAFLITSWALMVFADGHPKQAIKYGLVIPDVANMSAWLYDFSHDDQPWIRASSLPGPWLLFSSLGPPSKVVCLCVNALLVVGAAMVWWGIARVALTHPGWAVLAVVANPYLLLAMHGPNKEIPVLFLSLLVVSVVLHQRACWLVNAILICVLIYLFRDGYGVILAMWALSLRCFGQRVVAALALLVVVGVIGATLSGFLGQYLPFVGRQFVQAGDLSTLPARLRWVLDALAVEPTSPLIQPFLLAGRVLYNSASQALFPELFTEDGGIHILGFAYYLNGVLMLAAIPLSALVVFGGGPKPTLGTFASGALLSVVILSSVSLQIQPRYFMPMWPMAYLVLAARGRKVGSLAIAAAVSISLFTVLAYQMIGYPPAKAIPFDPDLDLGTSEFSGI